MPCPCYGAQVYLMLEVVLASAADLEPQFDWPGVSVLAIVNLGKLCNGLSTNISLVIFLKELSMQLRYVTT